MDVRDGLSRTDPTATGVRPLFDGRTLAGWRAVPRLPVAPWPGGPAPDTTTPAYRAAAATTGAWSVVDGAVVGGQDPEHVGLGGYLVSEDTFGDVELTLEVRPDWPADTGVMLRATPVGSQGYQVLVDHRRSGGIGGFYGNGIGGFHALAANIDVRRAPDGRPVGLVREPAAASLEPVTPDKTALLSWSAPPDTLVGVWRWDDWNELRVRCVGELPVLTTWVNGERIAELDTAAMVHPHWHPEAVRALLGRRGHIALEVHDNDPRMGDERWAPGAVVRWRGMRVRELG